MIIGYSHALSYHLVYAREALLPDRKQMLYFRFISGPTKTAKKRNLYATSCWTAGFTCL